MDTASASIADLHRALVDGALTCAALFDQTADVIARRDDRLRAVIALAPDVEENLVRLDAELRTSGPRSPLHGIPILIKDNIETADMATTAGSLALADNHTGRDAPLVAALRAAGAVIVGKANLSEWANFRSTRSSSGWSAVGGQCRNPHDDTRSPAGSSAGSAVGVAAGMAVAAIGTETSGSIVSPANVNGVVGFKPTVGTVSGEGIVPITHRQDVAGPLTRTVDDARLIFDAIRTTGRRVSDEGPSSPAGATAKRIGIVRSETGNHEAVDAVFDGAVARLRSVGLDIVDDLQWPSNSRQIVADMKKLMAWDFRHDLDEYLATLPGDAGELTLDRIIEFNLDHAPKELAYFGQEWFLKARGIGPRETPEYVHAVNRLELATRANGIDALLQRHRLDALIAPTGTAAWVIDQVNGDRSLGSCAIYPAVAGYPHLTVPAGRVHGLPVGISFIGTANSDMSILDLGERFEQTGTPWRPAALS